MSCSGHDVDLPLDYGDMDLLERAAELKRTRQRAVLITVIASQGSTPRKPGAKMLVFPDGHSEGTVGGGKVEHVIRDAAARALKREQPEVVHHNLTQDLGMACGGQMTFFVEPIMSQPVLILFGCGHIGMAIYEAAQSLGFDIVAVDDLAENAHPERAPAATRIVNSYDVHALGDLPFGEDTYVVIATRDHAFDQQLLDLCIDRPTHFLGVIGSPRKAKAQREHLLQRGMSEEAVVRIHCPIGLDIGAETPAEIAISILAEIVAARRGGAKFASRA
jgi:xanthine dehydrogenase accessory factor